MRKFQLTFGLVALIGFGLFFTMNGFIGDKNNKAYTYWQFDANSTSDIRTGTMYTKIIDPEAPTCAEGSDLPCVLQVEQSIDTQAELDTYLKNTSLFPNPEDITASALYQKQAN